MGCAGSKPEESPLVALCRERRELIRAAAEHRCALSAAHQAYFLSLGRVGDALQRFIEEELFDAASTAPGSPVLTLPPSDGKGKGKGVTKSKAEKSLEDVAAGGNAGDDGAVGAASPGLTAKSCLHAEDSHSHLPSGSDSEGISEESSSFEGAVPTTAADSTRSFSYSGIYGSQPPFYGIQQPYHGYQPPFYADQPPSYVGQPLSYTGHSPSYAGQPPFYANQPIPNSCGDLPIPSLYYMKSSTTKATTMYQNPYPQWYSSQTDMAYGYGYPMYGAQIDMPANPVQDERSHRFGLPKEEMASDPAPPPPEPEVSGWDFFDPFNSYEDLIPGYLNRYSEGSATSSPNSNEIREKEGIPDLEEETEHESLKVGIRERKVVVDEGFTKKGSGNKIPKEKIEIPKEEETKHEENKTEKNTFAREEKENLEREYKVHKLETVEEERSSLKRNMNFEVETSVVTEDSGLSKFSALSVHGTRDVAEVVNEIKEQFRLIAVSADEVSKILEVEKLCSRSRNNFLRVILERILDSMFLSISASSEVSLKNPKYSAASSLKTRNAEHLAPGNYVDIHLDNLSTTLEKLYAWEKKLYKEIKEEEKLRKAYDREWRQLKALDDSGAEASKIDDSCTSVRKLLTRLNMTVRSVNYISRRIHKVRDEELQPRLVDLIQGLVRMWKSIFDCHHKQFQAVVESKSHSFRIKTGISVAKVTVELEKELLNWCFCFSNWIQSQKAYVGCINGWLMKWLVEEKEETPDGFAPFSPSRVGAPPAFVISNDWYHTIDRILPDGVIDSMQAFASNIHSLWEMQDEEQRQKLKAEYLSKDFSKRLGSLQKENGMLADPDVLDKVKSYSPKISAVHDNHMMALDAMKKRLDEERAKHLETLKRVQETTASDLRTGLIPIFQALEDFSLDSLKAYEGVRMLNISSKA